MNSSEDAWPLQMEARLSALEVMLCGLASETGTRRAIARALETAAHKVVSDPQCASSDPEYGAALREACLEIARQLLHPQAKGDDGA